MLIIRPSALGDVCRSVPVLASLRAHWPSAAIDWLVQDSFADAVREHPMLTEVVPFPRRELGQAMSSLRLGRGFTFLSMLKHRGYDVVIDVQGLFRSGLFAWATRATRRVGYADAREGGWLGCTERHAVPAAHAVDRMVALVEAMGVPAVRDMRLYTNAEERAWVANDFRLQKRRFAVVAPTSRWAGKRWPIERFAEVTRALLDRELCVAVVGGRGEREQCGPILELAATEPRVVDLVGATSVARLMAVIEAATVVIANDSAALHMAVGFDVPAVALYGPTDIARVGPYVGPRTPAATSRTIVLQHLQQGDVLDHKQDGLGQRMMGRIQSEDVVKAIDAALQP